MKGAETCSCSLCNKLYTYLYHHIDVLDKYVHSNLVYYKHNGSDKPYDIINTLWTGDADLHLHITTVQDGRRTSGFLTCTSFPRTIHCLVPLHKGECFQRYHTLQHYLYSIS